MKEPTVNKKLSLALQKSGRLADDCINLLQKSGIKINHYTNQLLTQDNDFGIEFVFARDDDILSLVDNNLCDLGIVGENLIQEQKPNNIEVLLALGFAKCRLSLAYPKNEIYEDLDQLNDKTIATSYPNILADFLQKHHIQAKIINMHGSVELAPQIGIADLICDLVSTGAT